MLDFDRTDECQAYLLKIESRTNLFKSSDGRLQLVECELLLKDVCFVYESLIHYTDVKSGSLTAGIPVQILAECFRAMRNSCAGTTQNQNLISERKNLLKNTKRLLGSFVAEKDYSENPEVYSCLCCGIQFLGNLVTGSLKNQVIVWQLFRDLFSIFLSSENSKLISYTCMVIYNCSGEDQRSELITTDDGQAIIKGILKCLMLHDSEWGLYIIHDLFQYGGFLEDVFKLLDSSQKLILLEIMKAKIKEFAATEKEMILPFPVFCLSFIAEQLKLKSHTILGLKKQKSDDESDSMIVMNLLDILCAATSRPSPYDKVKDDTEIVACCINLLKAVKELGEQGTNAFSAVGKIDDLETVDTENPVYGLKCDLIRLIGNLVYKHRRNQTVVRELEGIPLILNHTNVDGRNPFITQWCVLAVRNLMEDNEENKAYLNDLKMEGVSNNTDLMDQFGVNALKRGDKVVVQKVEK